MTDSMERRGPDGSGYWTSTDRDCWLGHRRLSIIDLSEHGAQPMSVSDGRYTITFNGEIYNYQEIRKRLQQQGVHFQSHSDTEVLLYLYQIRGADMLHELRGMFAFIIWDRDEQAAFCARDPYGIKPLYYADNGSVVRMASQVKAIIAGGNVSSQVDPAGKAGFYMTGSVPEPFTFYSEIKALPAGSWMKISSEGVQGPVKWFSVQEVFAEHPPKNVSKEEYFEIVRESLLESVRYHMIADVQVGAFLSSGIDSTTLVGLMKDIGVEDIRTITLAFDEYKGKGRDEAPLARDVADLYQTRHSERSLAVHEFRSDLPHFLDAMDQPTIDGLNSYFVSKAASELGLKVVLSGLGGDELFAGYNTFQDVPEWVRKFKIPSSVPLLGKSFRTLYNAVRSESSDRSPKAASIFEYGGSYPGAYYLRRGVFMPWELGSVMAQDEVDEALSRLSLLKQMHATLDPDPGTPFGRVAALESSWYMKNQLLRDSDWAGMAHSLEVRVPFVDSYLLQSLASFTAVHGLSYMKQPMMDSPSTALPEGVRNKPKTGFFVPIQDWLQTEESVDAWRSHGTLSADGTPWARKWAYTVVSLAEKITTGVS